MMVERRYLKVGLALVVATAALVIGLSVGIARRSGRSSSPSNASALSAYDCEGDGASSSYYHYGGGGKGGKSGTASKSGKVGKSSSSGKSGKSMVSLLYEVSTESGASQEEMSYGGAGERGSVSMSLEFGRRLLDGEDSSSSASPRRRQIATTRRGLGSATRGEG